MEVIAIPRQYFDLVVNAASSLNQELGFLQHRLSEALGSGTPQPADASFLSDLLIQLADTVNRGRTSSGDLALPQGMVSVLKTVILYERRLIARQVDGYRRNTQHPEMLTALDERLEPFRYFSRQEWFTTALSVRIPRAQDYLTAQCLSASTPVGTSVVKAYDPKHGIFLAPSQLWVDLPLLRDDCDSRRLPVSVVFIDVDNFKLFNSALTEPVVDRVILPKLMRIIESGFFGHGVVYRFGGDEFVALLPNSPKSVVLPLLLRVRSSLASAEYHQLNERPTISMGVCELPSGSSMTEDEALSIAAEAKRFAKDAGRNAIAGHDGSIERVELWVGPDGVT